MAGLRPRLRWSRPAARTCSDWKRMPAPRSSSAFAISPGVPDAFPQHDPRGPRDDVAVRHRANRRHQTEPVRSRKGAVPSMPTITRRAYLALSALAPVAAGLLARESRSEAISSRDVIRDRYFPNVVLTTHEGRPVRFYDDLLKDRIVTINFMYTQCEDGRCPLTTANLVRVQKLLKGRVGRDIFMYSFTLTPEHDTPSVLKKYATAYGVGPGWTFLTGKPGDMERLRRKLGFAWANPIKDAKKASHTGNLRYGNEPLQLWSACPAMSRPEWIVESISWLEGPKNYQAS